MEAITTSDILQFLTIIAVMSYGWLLYKLSRIFQTKEDAAKDAKATEEAFKRIENMFTGHITLITQVRDRADEAHALAQDASKEASFANKQLDRMEKRHA